MAGQLNMSLRMATMTEEQRLRAAYDLWQRGITDFDAKLHVVSFEDAMKITSVRHMLSHTAGMMQRAEERGGKAL